MPGTIGTERTVKEELASPGGRPRYSAVPPMVGPFLPGWLSFLWPPRATRVYPPFVPSFTSKAARRHHLEALKRQARHLDRFLSHLWEEIIRLEGEAGEAD